MNDNTVSFKHEEEEGVARYEGQLVFTYDRAALELGVDHHYVRMLTSKKRFEIACREEVVPNVWKVWIFARDVYQYKEDHRERITKKVSLTKEEWNEFRKIFGSRYIKGE